MKGTMYENFLRREVEKKAEQKAAKKRKAKEFRKIARLFIACGKLFEVAAKKEEI